MDESRKKRPLADDPGFVSSLSDLDRGLTDAGGDDSPDDGTNNPVSPPRLIRRRIVRRIRRLPDAGTASARALSVPGAPAAPPMAAAPAPVALTAPARDARAGPPYETFYGLTE